MTTSTPRREREYYTADTDRTSVTAGLRALADLIDGDPAMPLPNSGKVSFHLHGDGAKAEARDLLRRIGAGWWDKKEWGSSLIFEGWLHGIPVDVWVDREQVCERRVVGTREITEEVPVGEDTRPTETITHTEEIVEWVCSPLLADETHAEATA